MEGGMEIVRKSVCTDRNGLGYNSMYLRTTLNCTLKIGGFYMQVTSQLSLYLLEEPINT